MAAVAGLIPGIVRQAVSLPASPLVAIVIAVAGAVAGYYVIGGDNPWLTAATLGSGFSVKPQMEKPMPMISKDMTSDLSHDRLAKRYAVTLHIN